jgi:hypothetical protein
VPRFVSYNSEYPQRLKTTATTFPISLSALFFSGDESSWSWEAHFDPALLTMPSMSLGPFLDDNVRGLNSSRFSADTLTQQEQSLREGTTHLFGHRVRCCTQMRAR